MKDFNQLKSEFVELCRNNNACQPEFKKLLESENEEQLLKVIFNNLDWCIGKKILTQDYFSHFNQETFIASGIANSGKENTGFVNSGNRNSGDSNSGYRNSGDRNSGNWNSGNWNSGDSNSGYRNSGDWNSGNWNSGNWNSGNRNSGDSNSGYRNSGNWNSGNRNSGYRNSGNWNSGNWNSGDRNSGDSNSGYRNSGAFCTDSNPELILFNKPSGIKVKDWENYEACNIMYGIDTTLWVPMSVMSDAEKLAHPKYETTEGYLKTIPIKEAWQNMWHNLDDSKKELFYALPNFSAEIFEEITSIKVK
jgi:Pentapeptide repeats (8 copies)